MEACFITCLRVTNSKRNCAHSYAKQHFVYAIVCVAFLKINYGSSALISKLEEFKIWLIVHYERVEFRKVFKSPIYSVAFVLSSAMFHYLILNLKAEISEV